MKPLHLIVHKSMIEEELVSDFTSSDRKIRLQKVLERINNIEMIKKDVRYLLNNNRNQKLDGIYHSVEICKGYSSIVLYGISMGVCLPYTKRKLEESGFSVEYDTEGVID